MKPWYLIQFQLNGVAAINKSYSKVSKHLNSQVKSKAFFVPLVIIWSVSMISLSVIRGIKHDYVAYLGQWQLVLDGKDPWSTDNTYGPIHNLLAYFLEIGPIVPKIFMGGTPIVPKIFMGGTFILVNFLLIKLLVEKNLKVSHLYLYGLFIPFNFLIIGIVFSYGLNDGLVASLIGLALIARFKERIYLVGICLGIAMLLKFYPALIVPFFCLDNRRIDLRALYAAAITFTLGMFASFVVWGNSVFLPLNVGVIREPNLLSILSSLSRNQVFENYPTWNNVFQLLISQNAILVVAVTVFVLVIAYKFRLSWIEGCVLAQFAFLLTYKVGHQQFYIPWLILLVGLLIADTHRSMLLAYCCVPYAIFLSMFQFGYEILTDGYNQVGGIVRNDVGYFAFILGLLTFVTFILVTRSAIERSKVL